MAITRRTDEAGPDAPELRIWLLGGFRVRVGSRDIDPAAWRLRKARSLVKLLALSSGGRLHREQVLEFLWPHLDPDAAANNFRKTLHIVRRTLEPAATGESARYCRVHDDVVGLAAPGAAWVDVDAFTAAAAAARKSGDPAAHRAALELFAGDLLPEDQYEEWSAGRRESLHQEWLGVLADLAAIYESQRDEARAIETLQLLVSRDAGREDAHRSLMRLYALTGQRQQALRQYQVVKESLNREFEAEPDEASRRLYEDIQAGRFPQPGSLGGRASHRTVDFRATGRTNLPLQLTSFVGRVRELAELRNSLIDARQLTLTGAGGVGKTRLALEVAARLLQDFPDGVWLADLSVVADPALVPQAVAGVVTVREESGRPVSAALGDYFLAKHALLLLDNCEHVAAACAQLAEQLLRRCPDLHVLTTSREVLGMQGELVHRVSSLSAPDTRRPCPIGELREFEAVRLFVDRAALSRPGFELTEDNAPMVGLICAHLDGIPLAIELAAARLNSLPVDAIAARLDSRFRLLSGGTRTALSRHQTLRAAMEWSYDLLSDPQRRLLCALSVFAGGFTLEAAQALGASDQADEMEVLELLGRLVDKSMVQLETPAGSARYRLLETVRDFARVKLAESGEADAARRRHAAFFLRLAERAEPELRGPRQASWLDRLEAEHDNFWAALEWSLGQQTDDTGLRLAVALAGYWHGRGYLTEGREWLERALRVGSEAGAVYAKALEAAARLAFAQDDFEPTVTILEKAVPLARAGGDVQALMLSLAWLGHAVWHRGDRSRSAALCAESLALSRSAAPGWATAVALAEVATVVQHEGERERAIPLLEESLVVFRAAGDSAGIARCLQWLGVEAANQGDYARAAALMQEALELQRHLGRKPAVAASLVRLGRIALLRGHPDEAIRLLKAGVALSEELGKTWDSPYHRKSSLGLALLAVGEVERAAVLFEETLAVRDRTGYRGSGLSPEGMADALLGLGIVARYREDGPRARQWIEEALGAFRARSDGEGTSAALYHLGLVSLAQDDLGRSTVLLRESLGSRQARGDRLGAADCLEALAVVARLQGSFEEAARLLGLAGTMRGDSGASRWAADQARYDRESAALRGAMGEEAFAAAWAVGAAADPVRAEQIFVLEDAGAM
ncbi:MAG TPA: tetratricopeptide repeat protein [bacterium]|nr:tetratricopeptide repeat protein [bacterium]